MNVNRNEDCSEPVAKKVCLTSNSDQELQTGETSGSDAAFEKLEKRLSLVLRCTVCLDLPKSSILQVRYIFLLFCPKTRLIQPNYLSF